MRQKKIIVVEDDAVIANLIELRLVKLGYQVVATVSDGKEAIEKAARLKPDLIIMDIKLPGKIDGIDTANYIGNHYDIPVVYLTADRDIKTFERAKDTKDCEYLYKPFVDNDLYIAIELAFHRHRKNSEIRKQEKYYSRIFENIDEGVITTDENGFINLINPVAASMMGIKDDMKKPTHIMEVMHVIRESDGQSIENPLNLVLRDQEGAEFPDDAVLVNPEQPATPVFGSVTPLQDEDGKMSGMIMRISHKYKAKVSEYTK